MWLFQRDLATLYEAIGILQAIKMTEALTEVESEESHVTYVLLLKSSKASDEYKTQIARTCHVDAASIPVLDFSYINLDKLATSLLKIKDYGGLIFTSARGVEAFSRALRSIDLQGDGDLLCSIANTRMYVVGRATESALMNVKSELAIDLKCDGSREGSAEKLASYMTKLNDVCDETRPFLFICGNIARESIPEILRSNNILVESICVYETVPDPNFNENLSKLLKIRGDPNVIVFFSPSGIEFSLRVIQNAISAFDKVKIVAIGNTTANAFNEKGYKIDGISETPTPEHLSICIKSIL